MADTPAGPIVLVVVGVGLLGLVPWQIFEAVLGQGRVAQQHDAKRRTHKRISSAARAAVYPALGLSAFRFVIAGSGSSEKSFGPVLLVVLAVGLALLWRLLLRLGEERADLIAGNNSGGYPYRAIGNQKVDGRLG